MSVRKWLCRGCRVVNTANLSRVCSTCIEGGFKCRAVKTGRAAGTKRDVVRRSTPRDNSSTCAVSAVRVYHLALDTQSVPDA